MSAVRVLGLLLVVAVCCLLRSPTAANAAPVDPTQSCQPGIGDSSYGTNQVPCRTSQQLDSVTTIALLDSHCLCSHSLCAL